MPLSAFTPQVREWFERAFATPTPAQSLAWPAIATGEHTLISAPTGSGKTLAAFLWGLDKLSREPRPEGTGTRLVYVSPLKALSYDVERNLRAPLRGIGAGGGSSPGSAGAVVEGSGSAPAFLLAAGVAAVGAAIAIARRRTVAPPSSYAV